MGTLFQDIRYGVRMLGRNPGFTIVAVLALSLGIGADSAIFSVVNAVLLRPLPFDHSENLVFLSERNAVLEGMSISYPNFLDWRSQNNAFENIGVYRTQSYNLTGEGEPERLNAGLVSADLFTVLRVTAARGRVFNNDEDRASANPVVVLSTGLWQRRFGGDENIIGRSLTLDGRSFTVIGIMPPTFQFPTRAEMWTPVGLREKDPGWQSRGNHPGLYAMARLKPGVTIAQARDDMEIVASNIEKQYPASNTGNRATLLPAIEIVVRNIRTALIVLLVAVGFVLLIAGANVANLLLARSTNRQKEMAIRTALGASRMRIIRQLLTESLLLSIVGGTLGLILAQVGVKLIVAISPDSIPRSKEISLDVRVLVFTVGVSVLTGIVFGLAPALQASKPDLNETLKDAGRGSTGRRHFLRNVLVVSEVALTMVLLIGAGLLIRSFYLLQRVDPGFNADNLLTFNVTLSQKKYPLQSQQVIFFQQLLQNLRSLPGVESVGMATGLPLGNNGWQSGFWIDGRPQPPQGQEPLTEVAFVNPTYFDTMKMTLLKGRNFTEQDVKAPEPPGATPRPFVAPVNTIIDEEFARQYFSDEEPLGKQLNFWGGKVTIVGVVRRVKMEGLSTDSNRVQSYYPYLENPSNGMSIVMRTTGDPARFSNVVREQVLAIDPDQPVFDVQTMGKIWTDSVAPDRLNLMLLGTFAAVALVLAAVGIYGVMAYSVTQRTHEIGIRMALGAGQGKVLSMVIRQGMVLTIIGLGIGLGGAFIATRAMASMLFGVSARDPITFAVISVILAGVALGACFVPARRATKVDPMIALRYE
jgi:putative ABC transport system permease protein